jgi:hypothetical protein
MAKTLQFRRGTTSELSTQTGAVGELFVDTTKDTVVVMDGSTAGGKALATEQYVHTYVGEQGYVTASFAAAQTNTLISGKQDTLVSGSSIKTINGQSILGSGDLTIAGGSGSSFDQDLNTTDDVVFNSALVGDVSIIGNEISGVDAYGNDTTLIVSSEMQVNVGSASTFNGNPTNNSIRLQLYSYDVSFFIQNIPYFNEDFVRALYNNNPNSSPVVSVTFPGAIGMPDTVVTGRLIANGGGNSGEWAYGNTNPATIQTIYFDTNYINEITINGIPVTSHPNYGNAFTVGQQVTFTTGSQTTPLSVTASGVNVDGTFTVNGLLLNPNGIQQTLYSGSNIKTINGQSILGSGDLTIAGGSGSSFDQSLNTTNDVVFNSALVGDVSIIGNEISGVDAYGNADTLVVDGNLNVKFSEVVTTTETLYQGQDFNDIFLSYAPSNTTGDWYISTPFSSEFASKIESLVGKAVNVSIVANGIFLGGMVQVNSVQGWGPGRQVSITALSGNILDLTNYFTSAYTSQAVFVFDNSATVTNTALSVTASGVNIDGEFTVNGQPVGGGSGSSFDQELNTTDDVVFNSALIGDVSIVSNTISAVDSYGNADTLMVDSKIITPALDVQVYTDSSVSYETLPSYGMLPYLQSYPWETSLNIYNYGGTENSAVITALAAKAGSGSRIDFEITSNYGISAGYLTVAYVSGGGSGYTFYFSQFVVTSGYDFYYNGMSIFGATFTIGEIVESLPLSVTETGVAIEGTLTVNGQEITPPIPPITYNQDLNTTDDVVFNSALIGDVSIIGNEISSTDVYGNSDRLVIAGDLEVINVVSAASVVTESATGGWSPTGGSYIAATDYQGPSGGNKIILAAAINSDSNYNPSLDLIAFSSALQNKTGLPATITYRNNVNESVTKSLVISSVQYLSAPNEFSGSRPVVLITTVSDLQYTSVNDQLLYNDSTVTFSFEMPEVSVNPLTVNETGVAVEGTLTLGNFTISVQAGKLVFGHQGTAIASLDSAGTFIALNNVTTGTP